MSEHAGLPSGWARAQYADLGTWSGGGTPSKANPEFWRHGSIPWVSPKDMKVERIADSEDHITEDAVRESAARLIPRNSVLFVTRSGILAHTFPVAVTTVDVTVNQDLKALTPHPGLSADYVAWGTRASAPEILRHCSKDGTTVASIDSERLATFELPVAPVREQHRIVEAIESYFTRLDDAVATLERVQRSLKRYRTSVLKAAVEGRLVPTEAELARADRRDYEPASVFLERILAERRRLCEDKGGRAKYREPLAPDTSGLPNLPEGWCWATLGHLTWSVKDGPHYSPRYVDEGGVPFVTGGNVRPNGIDFESTRRISAEVHQNLVRRVRPQQGDILYTKGGTTGIARVNTYIQEFSVWVHVAVLKLAGDTEPFFVQHALNSPWCYRQARKFTHGVGNQDLGLTRMVNITIPLPPLVEQKRIVTELDEILSVVDSLEASTTSDLLRCARLRQSILKWAFEGRLADQHPNDEPASVLLERIKLNRAAATPTIKTRSSNRRPRKTA